MDKIRILLTATLRLFDLFNTVNDKKSRFEVISIVLA